MHNLQFDASGRVILSDGDIDLAIESIAENTVETFQEVFLDVRNRLGHADNIPDGEARMIGTWLLFQHVIRQDEAQGWQFSPITETSRLAAEKWLSAALALKPILIILDDVSRKMLDSMQLQIKSVVATESDRRLSARSVRKTMVEAIARYLNGDWTPEQAEAARNRWHAM
jgi:hypothetical protein